MVHTTKRTRGWDTIFAINIHLIAAFFTVTVPFGLYALREKLSRKTWHKSMQTCIILKQGEEKVPKVKVAYLDRIRVISYEII